MAVSTARRHHRTTFTFTSLEAMSITLPTHHFIPDENDRFYESKATLIANEILESELKGKVDAKWVDEWSKSGDKFEVRYHLKRLIHSVAKLILTAILPAIIRH